MKASSYCQEALDLLLSHKRFLIVSHEEPEGDCLGASLALKHSLCARGSDAVVYNHHGVPHKYAFLRGAEDVVREVPPGPWDVIVVLDCSELSRIGPMGTTLPTLAPHLLNIDHHLGNRRFGSTNWVDPEASSTGELLYRLMKAGDFPFSPTVYQGLLCAVVTDTGSFRYANTTTLAFTIGAEALRGGAAPWDVAKGIYERNRLSRIQALARALDSITLGPDGRWSLMTVTHKMLQETGANLDDTEGFINYARSIEGVEVAILIREDGPNLWKISLRSKGRVNVSTIARPLGGGGHHNAAACKLALSREDALEALLPHVEAHLSALDNLERSAS